MQQSGLERTVCSSSYTILENVIKTCEKLLNVEITWLEKDTIFVIANVGQKKHFKCIINVIYLQKSCTKLFE